MPAFRLLRTVPQTVWKIEKKSLNNKSNTCHAVTAPEGESLKRATEDSLHNFQEDINAPRYSISGKSKESYASKYGSFCLGTTDIGTLLTQQLRYEGHSPASHQWKFLEAMYQHKVSKEYQLMNDMLCDLCETNIKRHRNNSMPSTTESSMSLNTSDILHMKSYIHHIQNPRYGLTRHKAGRVYQETKKCLLELGVAPDYFHV
jgi:hypothetical protein